MKVSIIAFFLIQCEAANITLPSFSEVYYCRLVIIIK